ncbi:uncharacterized protein LOC118428567 [Branchiostoma floridae]|uniref:Uncharacterized protein LOC118428567 n=1 Tax=Branchiostoma floridae TaxID=7739 RepID=C3YWD8_BRAFL|nr:uncharacterized protein LOC118428567 [Branchiostoma floridae]|eukprot:XP_002599170.1 hypothetical protein BRAFLDRAFT_64475 [Branchiostoma floridae]
MAASCLISGVFAAMLLISGASAAFNPALNAFSRAVALDRTLVDIPHRLLCHELCLKDVSCASFQYDQTSRECRVSIVRDDLEEHPDDDVDDSLHDLSLDGLLPTSPGADSILGCTSEPDACINGHVCQETCTYDGAMTCSCRSSTWDRDGCRSVDVGSWEEWQSWGDCSATCGGGMKTRMRTCNDQYDGKSCVGKSTENRACAETPCPVWSEWSSWTKCQRCGRSRTRTRTCPSPGKCHGAPDERSSCMGSRECSTLVRLQRGLYVTDGWVEVWDQLNGYWRPLCGNWTQENGKVACHHVGFKDVEEDTPLDIMSLGCFNDTPSENPDEEAWNATAMNGPNTSASSPADCLAFCYPRGFKYAAIRSKDVCQCGRGYARNGQELSSMCSWKCAGDTSRTCGSELNDHLNDVFAYAPLGNSLYFPMDEKRAHSGEIMGEPSVVSRGGAGLIDGIVGKALYLDGNDQWAKSELLDGSCLGSTDYCEDSFSIGMWLKLMDVPDGDRYYLSTGGHTQSSYGFSLWYNAEEGKGPGFNVRHREASCKSHFDIPVGTWIHLVLSWRKPCDINIYINSTRVADLELRFEAPTQLDDYDRYTAFAIGAPNNKVAPKGLSGHAVFDELRFWDRKLDGKEIHQVMMHDLRMSGDHYHPPPGSKVMKGKYKCTGEEPLLGMCEHEEDSSLADELCHTSNLAFVRCVPYGRWDGWSAWTECKDGRTRRTRKCSTPSPHYEGDCRDSPGKGQQAKSCEVNPVK